MPVKIEKYACKAITTLRKELGMSMSTLAKKSKVSKANLSKIENKTAPLRTRIGPHLPQPYFGPAAAQLADAEGPAA